jgi:hypothetical protein
MTPISLARVLREVAAEVAVFRGIDFNRLHLNMMYLGMQRSSLYILSLPLSTNLH